MLKKLLSAFLCVAMVFAFSSCEENATGDSIETSSQMQEDTTSYPYTLVLHGATPTESVVTSWLGERTDIEDINAGDYDDIITNVYSAEDLVKLDFYNNLAKMYLYSRRYRFGLDSFEFECYRRPSDNTIYSILKFDDGTVVYCFSSGLSDGFESSHMTAASKKLKYSDFDGIIIGATLEEISNVEPAAERMIRSITFDFKEKYEQLSTMLILTDGVLRLEYQYSEEMGYVLSKKNLYSDFKFPHICDGDKAIELDYTILEKDYPKN